MPLDGIPGDVSANFLRREFLKDGRLSRFILLLDGIACNSAGAGALLLLKVFLSDNLFKNFTAKFFPDEAR